MSVLAEFLAAVEPPAGQTDHAGWPLLAVAAFIALCGYCWIYRRRPWED